MVGDIYSLTQYSIGEFEAYTLKITKYSPKIFFHSESFIHVVDDIYSLTQYSIGEFEAYTFKFSKYSPKCLQGNQNLRKSANLVALRTTIGNLLNSYTAPTPHHTDIFASVFWRSKTKKHDRQWCCAWVPKG